MDKEYRDELPSSSKWVTENFVLGDILGSGTFGKVYTVECRKKPNTLYALKEISRGSLPRYIASELKIMKQLGGSHNVMNVHAAFREKDRVFIIMDHFPHDSLTTLLGSMTESEKIDYMKNLFISLDFLHKNNIIHRDVKPANFLYNRRARKFALIDFGLSQAYEPKPMISNRENSIRNVLSPRKRASKCLALSDQGDDFDTKKRKLTCDCTGVSQVCHHCVHRPNKTVNKAGTPGYRAPEILLKFDNCFQTPAIDIWAAGITLMGLLFRRNPVFRPADDFEAIAQLCQVFGSAPLEEAARLRGTTLIMQPSCPGVDLAKLMKAVRPGIEVLDGPGDRCNTCAKMFFENVKGRCLCKSGEPCSLEGLNEEERLLIDILIHCLQVDPVNRFRADMILDLIEMRRF
ncbi:unnamed protein product [Auanema sp. JU1783]|nr:unnamed protein product [Auanema sp. JU1783]